MDCRKPKKIVAVEPGNCEHRVSVIFVTSVFGEVHNGPALYANYLWETFRDDPELDFHMVTPSADETHPNLHESGNSTNSRELYESLQEKALFVASQLLGRHPIIHSNNAHCMRTLRSHNGPLMGQVNDYDAARVISEPLTILRRHGCRRLLSLVYRNRNERAATRFADCIVSNSKFVQQEIQHRYNPPPHLRLEVVHKAIDIAQFSGRSLDGILEYDLPPGRNLLFLGSNWLGKGLDVAIRAIAMLPSEFQDVNLIVAGKASSGEAQIKRLIQNLKIESRVKLLGNISRKQLPMLMHETEVLVFPSHNEAFGVAVLEALAVGIPVVASDVGGIPEILEGAKFSQLVSADDSEAFARAIEKVLTQTTGKDEIKAEGRSIAERFSKEKMTSEIKEIYRQLNAKVTASL